MSRNGIGQQATRFAGILQQVHQQLNSSSDNIKKNQLKTLKTFKINLAANNTFDGTQPQSSNANGLILPVKVNQPQVKLKITNNQLLMPSNYQILDSNRIQFNTQPATRPKYTAEGYEVCSTRTEPIPNESRYINHKMERELVQFKHKIMTRFQNKEIPDSYKFPRVFLSQPEKGLIINRFKKSTLAQSPEQSHMYPDNIKNLSNTDIQKRQATLSSSGGAQGIKKFIQNYDNESGRAITSLKETKNLFTKLRPASSASNLSHRSKSSNQQINKKSTSKINQKVAEQNYRYGTSQPMSNPHQQAIKLPTKAQVPLQVHSTLRNSRNSRIHQNATEFNQLNNTQIIKRPGSKESQTKSIQKKSLPLKPAWITPQRTADSRLHPQNSQETLSNLTLDVLNDTTHLTKKVQLKANKAIKILRSRDPYPILTQQQSREILRKNVMPIQLNLQDTYRTNEPQQSNRSRSKEQNQFTKNAYQKRITQQSSKLQLNQLMPRNEIGMPQVIKLNPQLKPSLTNTTINLRIQM